MKNMFKEYNKEIQMMAVCYILFGIILCLFNKNILMVGARIIGVLVLIYGAIQLYFYFYKRTSTSAVPLFIGLPATAFGALMLFSPESIIAIIPILSGFVIIVHSIIQIQKSLILKDNDYENWIWSFAINVILLLVGTFILLKPIQTVAFVLRIVGICLIVEAISMLISQREVNKYLK